MTKQEKIQELENTISKSLLTIEKCKLEKETLLNRKELTFDDLVDQHRNGVLNTTPTLGEYEYILGGDGRSSPWSKTKIGNIVKIENSIDYISKDDTIKFIKYLKLVLGNNIDEIYFNGITI